MIKEKKPEKIILDFTYVKDTEDILQQIKRTGLCCVMQNNDAVEKESVLYITDDGMKASQYKTANKAVLVYLHEANQEENFSKNRYFIEGFEDADATYFTRLYQREKKIPWVIGETDRLIVREMTPEDTTALYALYEDKSVVEFMEDLPRNCEEEAAYIAEYIDKMYGFFGFGMWLVELKENGEVIGRVGFQNCEIENDEDLVELGFLISPKHQKQGYAYEACKAAIAYMNEEFPEYKRVARCKKENEQAIALCEKLGIHYLLL